MGLLLKSRRAFVDQATVIKLLDQGKMVYMVTGAGGIIFKCLISPGLIIDQDGRDVTTLLVKFTPVDTPKEEFVIDKVTYEFRALSTREIKSEFLVHQHLYLKCVNLLNFECCPMPVALLDVTALQSAFFKGNEGFLTVMEYIESAPLEDADIPQCRGLVMVLFKLGYLQGDLHKGNFIKNKKGKVFILDFGRAVYMFDDIKQLIRTNFAHVIGHKSWDEVEQDWHIVFVINLFVPIMMYKYSCHDNADKYWMYLFLITGTLKGVYSPFVKCSGDFIKEFDYKHFRQTPYEIVYPKRSMVNVPNFPLQNDLPINEISRQPPSLSGGKPPLKKFNITKKVRRGFSKRRN